MMPQTIFSIFQAQAEERADSPFLMQPDSPTLTYKQAFARTGQIANLFLSLGVEPGDRIAVQADKSVDTLLTYLAAMRIGAVYLPLNTAYTANEAAFFLSDAAPTLFLHRPQDMAEMATLCADVGVRRHLALGGDAADALGPLADAQPTEAPVHEAAPDDLAAILYTSGTTGRSKGAMLSQANLLSNASTLARYWQFTGTDRLLHALPIFHTHGLFVATNVSICAGSAMMMLPKYDAAQLIELMPSATVLMGVPTFYSRLLAQPGFTREVTASMRLFISGSAPLSAETHKLFRERTGQAILERYGMTETNMNTSNPYDGDRVAGTVGFPLPGVELRITDPATGTVLAQGEAGMIEVRGPNVFQGYWQLPEKTAEEMRPDGFFITGDLGMVDERGYVSIVGRAKDLIISGGLNIYPAEVEALLDAVPGVEASAVIGLPHPDMGEAVVAVLQADPSAVDEADVMAALDGRLARFKQPRRLIFVPELPRNMMGKIQKKQLREDHAQLFTAETC